MKKNSVIFKGRNGLLTIIFDEDLSFEELKKQLRLKLSESSSFFNGARSGVAFKGRTFTEDEELELLNIVKKESDLDISFVDDGEGNLPARKRGAVGRLIASDSKTNNTTFHKGSLRSGQELRFAGSIVVIGDVNPGAEIIAEGNIIVLGSLKGLVHAGCKGMKGCFVAALGMNPMQLRIGEIITYFPEEMRKQRRRRGLEYAYVDEGQIYIEPLE